MRRLIRACRVCVLAWAFLLLASFPVHAWEAEVVRVVDGDTISVMPLDPAQMPDAENWDGKVVRVRLHGIDAPEGKGRSWESQPYSRKATEFLQALLPEGARVAVLDMGYDKYERTVAGLVSLPGGKVVQEELLRVGLAWVYPKYCPDCRQWKALEKQARTKKQGLWQGSGETKPVAPWEWRRKD